MVGVNTLFVTCDGKATFDLYVEPEQRGQGLAKEIMANIISEADEAGVDVHIFCDPSDMEPEELAHFYTRFGFESTGVHHSGAVFMVRKFISAYD